MAQVAQGGRQLSWQAKFWLRTNPGAQAMHPSAVHLVHPVLWHAPQVKLEGLRKYPGAHFTQATRLLALQTRQPSEQGAHPLWVKAYPCRQRVHMMVLLMEKALAQFMIWVLVVLPMKAQVLLEVRR